jgi:ATP-dependent DNA ligase
LAGASRPNAWAGPLEPQRRPRCSPDTWPRCRRRSFVRLPHSSPGAKGAVLTELLECCDPLAAKYAVKILTGELRIGLREGLLEAAIAEAFGKPQAAVGMAMMLTGDTGEAAVLALENRLDEARLRLLHPI